MHACAHTINTNASLSGSKQMEGMVTDLQLAREKQQNFETWKDARGKASRGFRVGQA